MGSGFKDFAAGDTLTAADVDDYLMRQTVMTFATTTARDTALTGVLAEGMVAHSQATDVTMQYDGSAWRTIGDIASDWTTSAGAVLFNASGTNVTSVMRYRRIWGTTIEWECEWVLGGAPTAGDMTITLPVAVANDGANVGQVVGQGVLLDAGTARYTFTVMSDASSATVMFCNNSPNGSTTSPVASTNPFTWTTSDAGVASGRYRAAVG